MFEHAWLFGVYGLVAILLAGFLQIRNMLKTKKEMDYHWSRADMVSDGARGMLIRFIPVWFFGVSGFMSFLCFLIFSLISFR